MIIIIIIKYGVVLHLCTLLFSHEGAISIFIYFWWWWWWQYCEAHHHHHHHQTTRLKWCCHSENRFRGTVQMLRKIKTRTKNCAGKDVSLKVVWK